MAKKHGIYVYDKNERDFTTTGLVGDLTAIQAVFVEEKNGASEIQIKLPYDEYQRWKKAKIGNLIKCAVPVRIPPAIKDDEYANTVQVGT